MNRARLAISLGVGILVCGIAVVASWQQYASTPNLSEAQFFTRMQIQGIDREIQAYRSKTGSFPLTLSQLREIPNLDLRFAFQADGSVNDSWNRPFQYSTDGKDYTLRSLGRDGQPGGAGLDCDLTNHQRFPPGWFPTFRQFLLEMQSGGILFACAFAGFLAFLTSIAAIREPDISRAGFPRLAGKVVVTALAALLVAYCMSVLELPTGH